MTFVALLLSQSVIIHIIIQNFFIHYHVYKQEHELPEDRQVPSNYVEQYFILQIFSAFIVRTYPGRFISVIMMAILYMCSKAFAESLSLYKQMPFHAMTQSWMLFTALLASHFLLAGIFNSTRCCILMQPL